MDDKIDLEVLSDYGSKEVIKESAVSLDTIKEVMGNIDWNIFHQVSLFRSDNEWIMVGGNLGEAGLACMYEENNEQFVIDKEPNSVHQLTEILVSYYLGDGKFKTMHKFTGESDEKKQKEEKNTKYSNWKVRFEKDQKKERRIYIRNLILLFIPLILIFTILFLWSEDELQFVGHETTTTSAIITETNMRHIGKGLYMQRVTYRYKHNDETYFGTFEVGKVIGKQNIGNRIKIKISVSDPKRSKRIKNDE